MMRCGLGLLPSSNPFQTANGTTYLLYLPIMPDPKPLELHKGHI